MKLLLFSINNFRGIESETVNADGHNIYIYGRNGAGKTSTEDAFLWLLFGKDSADRKDYDLIPHKPGATEPDVGRGLEPTVAGLVDYACPRRRALQNVRSGQRVVIRVQHGAPGSRQQRSSPLLHRRRCLDGR